MALPACLFMKSYLCSIILISYAVNLLAESNKLTDEQLNFFERKIRPVLADSCYECHATTAKKVKGGLLLDYKEAALRGGDNGPGVVPGKVDESLILRAIKWADKDMEMPPKKKLPDAVIADFEAWIKMGAPDPRGGSVEGAAAASSQWKKKEINIEEGRQHWAYQLPKKAAVPSVKNTGWPKSVIDQFVLAKLEEKNLRPVRDAEKRDLIRRATFDLTGLPPTPDEVNAFLADKSPDAFANVVDGLLASDHFGEHWGRHWLDVARYAESAGKDVNVLYPFAWRYRDWVIEAFNKGMPYNEFIQEQIAGDLLPFKNVMDQSKKIVATGFLAIGSKPHNERNPKQFALEVADEQIDTLSQAFLATTVACARCHDHKFDPIPQKDYYALAGILLSSDTLYGTNAGVQNNHPSDLIDLGKESGMSPGFDGISTSERTALDQRMTKLTTARSEKTKEAFTARRNGKEVEILQLLALRQQLGDLSGQVNRYDKNGQPRILAMGVYERPYPVNSPIYARGDATQPGETVPRGFVQVVSKDAPQLSRKGSGRLELAKWLSSEENPLTARVMTNRIWRWLLGRGIVSSMDNFGTMGEKPVNPELLDYLSVSFMENGWSVKKLVREIMLSRTYQLASVHAPSNFTTDPENTLNWRMNSKPLPAESLRDAMLSVSGKLDSYPPDSSLVCRAGEGREGLLKIFQTVSQPQYFRSAYLPIIRDQLPETLSLFDFADPSLVTGDRESTNVPSQGLYLMNNTFVQKLSDDMARRVYDSGKDNAERISNAYLLAYGRPATQNEQAASRAFFSNYLLDATKAKAKKGQDVSIYAWSAFCQALMASAEFRYLN